MLLGGRPPRQFPQQAPSTSGAQSAPSAWPEEEVELPADRTGGPSAERPAPRQAEAGWQEREGGAAYGGINLRLSTPEGGASVGEAGEAEQQQEVETGEEEWGEDQLDLEEGDE